MRSCRDVADRQRHWAFAATEEVDRYVSHLINTEASRIASNGHGGPWSLFAQTFPCLKWGSADIVRGGALGSEKSARAIVPTAMALWCVAPPHSRRGSVTTHLNVYTEKLGAECWQHATDKVTMAAKGLASNSRQTPVSGPSSEKDELRVGELKLRSRHHGHMNSRYTSERAKLNM